MVDLAGWPCFRFIRMSVIGLVVGLGEAESLIIGRAVLMKADVAAGFFGLFL